MLLELSKASKVYQQRSGRKQRDVVALENLDLAIAEQPATITAIAGESGSGKTTLARMILGLTQPTSGIIRYKSKNLTQLTRQEKRWWFLKEVQPIFQNPFATFSPLKRIETYLFETASNYNVVEKENVNQYVDDILGLVGLSLAEISG